MDRNLVWTLVPHEQGHKGISSRWEIYNPSIHGIIDNADLYTLEESRQIDEQRYLTVPFMTWTNQIQLHQLQIHQLQEYKLQILALWRKSRTAG